MFSYCVYEVFIVYRCLSEICKFYQAYQLFFVVMCVYKVCASFYQVFDGLFEGCDKVCAGVLFVQRLSNNL